MPSVAFVGAAHIHASEFLEMLDEHPACTLAGVHEAQLAPARAAFEDPAVDAIVLTSRTVRHRELAVAAAEAGKALFVEKPLGATVADARAIAAAVQRAGVLFSTGYFLRGDPAHRALRRMIGEGRLGRVTRVRVVNTNPAVLLGWFDGEHRWMTDPEQAGVGAWGDEGAHAVDLLRWLTGQEVVRVVAALATVTGRYGAVDELGEALLELDGGTLATVAAGWVDHGDVVQVEVAGTGGHAHVAGRRLHVTGDDPLGTASEVPADQLPPALPHAFELFLDALAGADVPLVDAHDAAATTAVLHAAYAAAASGGWTEPEPV